MKKTIFSWGVFALALTSFAPTVQAQQKTPKAAKPLPSWSNQQYLSINLDSSTDPPQRIVTLKSDALYNMTISQNKLTSLFINGRPVPADSFYLYDGLVKRVEEQVRRDSAQAERDKEQAERDAQQALRDKQQAERDGLQAMKDREQALLDKKHAEEDAQQAARDKVRAERDAVKEKVQAERDMQQAMRDKKQAMRDAEQAGRDREQAVRDKQQALRDKEQAERDRKQAEEDKMLLQGLLGDAVKEGLAPDEKSIKSLILDDSVFFVNGKKQSDELHKKFKEKYIKKEGYSYYIGNHMIQIGRRD